MTVDAKVEEYLKVLLNGISQQLMQVDDYIKNTEEQLKAASASRVEMQSKATELEEMLGIESEDEGTESEDEDTEGEEE